MDNLITGKPDVLKREVAIIDYLRNKPEGATAREIYEDVSEMLGDTISRPAYYKLLDRLVVAGQIDQDESDDVRRYVILPQIHATNRLTLDDIYEMLPFIENTESMARAIEAQQYFYEHRNDVIRETALALVTEPAVDIFFAWIHDLLDMLRADLDSYGLIEEEGEHHGEAVLADERLEYRLKSQCITLREILYRHLSVPHNVVDIPPWDGDGGLKRTKRFFYDPNKFKEALKHRVFGVGTSQTVLGLITIDKAVLRDATQEMIVSGSDGSFHAGTMGIRTARGYIEDESFVVTFNNSVAYVRSSERVIQQRGDKKYVYSAPLTRETLNDPTYKGMVLAPFMFPMLTESEYEHMARTASDVVQMRVDDEIFNGKARDIATGEQIMPPRVHIRDGTITPQERGFNHYTLMNPYGDIAREGIQRSRSILQRIVTGGKRPRIYAGAVKSTQIRLFSRFINWYISKGSRLTKGKPIEPNWDVERAGYISDIDVMTALLSSQDLKPQEDSFWISCVVLRQFASLTDFFDTVVPPSGTWFDVIKRRRDSALKDYEEFRGQLPYHAMMSVDDLTEDSYLYMLEHADYASFYIGHTWGEPPPKIPRYEFMCSLRKTDKSNALEQVQDTVSQLVTALLVSSFSQDKDHNFLSNLSLVKLIPFVVQQAHELAKHLGKKLESEYKSMVVKRLVERRKERIEEKDVDINPIGLRRYLQRFSNVRKALPDPEKDDYDRR